VHDALVPDSVLSELHQPFVRNGIEKATNVGVQHPVHMPLHEPDVQGIQRIVLAAPWAEPIRETSKLRFVDGVQDRHGRPLNDLVFQNGQP
jgi:hypothetical protein